VVIFFLDFDVSEHLPILRRPRQDADSVLKVFSSFFKRAGLFVESARDCVPVWLFRPDFQRLFNCFSSQFRLGLAGNRQHHGKLGVGRVFFEQTFNFLRAGCRVLVQKQHRFLERHIKIFREGCADIFDGVAV